MIEHDFENSSNLHYGRHEGNEMTLTFKKNGLPGDSYVYPGVTEEEFNALANADLDPTQSAGTHFHNHFGRGSGRRMNFRKVDQEDAA